MSQNLTPLPALTLPYKVTQAGTLSANVAAVRNMTGAELLSLSVQSLSYLLHSVGGFDYRTNHLQLRIDATSFLGGFSIRPGVDGSHYQRQFESVLDWNKAYFHDNTIPTLVNSLELQLGGLKNTPETTLETFILFLRYQLSILGY